MNIVTKTYFWLSFSLLLFLSCSDNTENDKKPLSTKEKQEKKEMLEKANKGLVKIHNERIIQFAKRRKWNLTQTETGLWYEIYKTSNGVPVKTGDVVTLKYSIILLDGTLCYSSDSLGLKSFKVGQGGVESGLEEGILLLKNGDKARLVMPPYMAWGLPGDGDKIPPLSIIAYILELVDVQNEN
ncbi:MAG: FKBP-type peptidyl-prolyl cis-trans isomerase [Bacteroidales bacterium]|nr:FKBP-type peptidyl-prolyl cis-trans isomerase [Bacteroidales bacterium]